MRTDEKDQRERSTKKVKMNGEGHGTTGHDSGDESQDRFPRADYGEDPNRVTNQQDNKVNESLSYKNMLLGVNGTREDYQSDDNDNWMIEDDSEEELQEMVQEQNKSSMPINPNYCRRTKKTL